MCFNQALYFVFYLFLSALLASLGLPVKKISHRRGASPCAPKNLEIILDNLFLGNPFAVDDLFEGINAENLLSQQAVSDMKTFTAIAQRDPDTKFYVGSVPDFPRTDSQGETCMICRINLREVIKMLLKDEELVFETEFVSTQQIVVYYT